MTGKTHTTIAICVTVPFISISNIIFLPFAVAGAMLPDFDYKFGLEHRGVTHSLLCMVISSLFVWLLNGTGALFFCIGYISHLLLDSLTVSKIPLLYPCKKRIGFGIYKTRSNEDYLLRYIVSLAALYIMCNRLGLY